MASIPPSATRRDAQPGTVNSRAVVIGSIVGITLLATTAIIVGLTPKAEYLPEGCSADGASTLGKIASVLSRGEGLTAHARSAEMRFK
jgi:hypothetical protein